MKSSSASDRKTFIEFGNKRLTVKRQAELLKINRTSVYRNTPVKTVTDEELLIMHRIDELHTKNQPGAIAPLPLFLEGITGY